VNAAHQLLREYYLLAGTNARVGINNMKFLVVDDFSTVRRIVKNMLASLGCHNVQQADDGRTALPMLKKGNFDFVIVDGNMAGMQGIDLVKHIRADEELKHLPILMITDVGKREQIIKGRQAGVNGFIEKPFTAAVLKEKLGKIYESLKR
jgi:two-component system chemotaxis response regulator CheY